MTFRQLFLVVASLGLLGGADALPPHGPNGPMNNRPGPNNGPAGHNGPAINNGAAMHNSTAMTNGTASTNGTVMTNNTSMANSTTSSTNGTSTRMPGVTWVAPANTDNTNLTTVLTKSGAPGIYDSSTTDQNYGQYNWCNMPHVRAQEYKKPSKDYQLEYVEVVQRHHKRTPYASNTFFKEDITWNCDKEGPFANAKASTFDTTPINWQAQRGTQNPFEKTVGPGFVNSTCVFPAITTGGLEDARQHGKDLKAVYGDMLNFLPQSCDRDQYSFRVTNNVITTQTLGGLVKGLFPDLKEHSAWIQSSTYDSLEPTYSCPAASALLSSYQGSNPAWTEHLNRSQELRNHFNAVSGIENNDSAGWASSWDHPYDNLSAKQCHQKALPCSVNDTSICITQSDANSIYRLGNYEYAYRYRMAPNSTLYSALKMGAFMKELQGHIQDKIAGTRTVKYQHNFAHDGSMAPLLGLLQIDQPVWPGMGTEIVFELWKKGGNRFIRVMFSGQPIKTSTYLGTLDMIPLADFTTYLNSVIPNDIVAACKAS